MKVAKLFFCLVVVLHVFTSARFCYAGRRLPGSQVDVLKHSNRLNTLPLKSIKSPDGDIIDCVHISHQPAFDHPALKNHTIKMMPSYYPNWIKDGDIKVSSRMNASNIEKKSLVQLWHSNGKCPKDTIPIIRTKKASFVKKSSFVTHPNRNGHEYASAYTRGHFYGAKATLNLWNPKVQEVDEFSLTQIWILGGSDSDMNSIEAGWQAAPNVYKGDTKTRLFIYWTSNSYLDGCYNHKCAGFMQTNNEIALGGSISPTSQVDGSQYEITILIWKDPKDGDWWMQLGDDIIGYWPAGIFTYLSESASLVYWGGEVINNNTNGHHTTTQMGSGYFPEEGYKRASYVRNIQTVDETVTLKTPEDLTTYVSGKNCYDIKKGINDDWGNYFFYGGPGQNQKCK